MKIVILEAIRRRLEEGTRLDRARAIRERAPTRHVCAAVGRPRRRPRASAPCLIHIHHWLAVLAAAEHIEHADARDKVDGEIKSDAGARAAIGKANTRELKRG